MSGDGKDKNGEGEGRLVGGMDGIVLLRFKKEDYIHAVLRHSVCLAKMHCRLQKKHLPLFVNVLAGRLSLVEDRATEIDGQFFPPIHNCTMGALPLIRSHAPKP